MIFGGIMNNFKKSGACGTGCCVEVDLAAQAPNMGIAGFSSDTDIGKEGVSLRKSKNPDIVIFFSDSEWKTFVVGVKLGEFDK